MTRLSVLALIGIGVFIAPSLVLGATIEFSSERVYVVPGVDKIDEALFNDVNHDGLPEVLARRGNHILVFSESENAVLFETDIDTAKWRGLVFADINRDSVVDIAVACFHDYYQYSDSALTIDVYDGSAGFVPTRQYFPSAYNYTWDFPKYSSELTAFKALDMNGDGYDELFLSYCNWVYHPNFPTPQLWRNDQYGICKVFYSFPDLLLWSRAARMNAPTMVDDGDAPFLMAAGLLDYSYRNTTEYYISRRSAIRFDTSFDSVYVFSDDALSSTLDKNTCITSRSSQNLLMKCAGDLVDNNGTREFLADFYYLQDCYNYNDPPGMPDSMGEELRMYRMPSPDSAEIVWVHAPERYSDYIFLPDYPGYYFAFSNNQLIQLDGATGEQTASSQAVPSGTGHWDYPYRNGQPRRVVLRADTVTIFRIDTVTDTDDEGPLPLPGTLSIGTPYPNPFNAAQTIPVMIRPGSRLMVDVYDILGRKVERLFDGAVDIGNINLVWNAGAHASGIYFVRAASENESAVVRSILIK